MKEIKCSTLTCKYNNQKRKYGCTREADPNTCKSYLVSIIGVMEELIIRQQARIVELELKI